MAFTISSLKERATTRGKERCHTPAAKNANGLAMHHIPRTSQYIQNLVSPPPRSIPTIVTDETDTNIVMNAIVTINSFARALVSGGIV